MMRLLALLVLLLAASLVPLMLFSSEDSRLLLFVIRILWVEVSIFGIFTLVSRYRFFLMPNTSDRGRLMRRVFSPPRSCRSPSFSSGCVSSHAVVVVVVVMLVAATIVVVVVVAVVVKVLGFTTSADGVACGSAPFASCLWFTEPSIESDSTVAGSMITLLLFLLKLS
uniref:(northern house mosquito) hypothetical protein n=1 Tax=Culex pipiens TaxID=7175 RepID=A0A8D8KBN8_CULPI